MTTFTPYSQNKNAIPAPPDQPTPQSPPSSFMSSGHAPTNAMTTDKFNNNNNSNNNHYHTSQSFSNVSTPPSSIGRPVIQTTSTASSLLTPSSTSANSTHEDMEIDSFIDDGFGDSNPNKRRRTYGSFEAERRSPPANLRHAGSSTDDMMAASPSMQQIQELITNPDCSPYHLVCQKMYEKSYPDPTENLIQLYGLQTIADKVARFDATGKKNKLRKSYKGHIATLSGKNEVVAKPTQLGQYYDQSSLDPAENKLQMLAFYPDEEWRLQHVMGKEMSRGFDMAKVRRGLANITKGDIPRFDATVLGLDEEMPRKRIESARSPQMSVGTPQHNGSTTPGNASTASGGPGPSELIRPERKNKKRSYHDGSYEGYEEEDESGGTAGNGPGGGNGSGASVGGGNWPGDPNKQKKKKRKKNPDVDSPGGMDLGRHSVPIYGR